MTDSREDFLQAHMRKSLFIRKAHLPEQNSKFMLPRIFTQQTTRRMQTKTALSITASHSSVMSQEMIRTMDLMW